MYLTPSRITGLYSNNSFSLQKRPQEALKTLYIPMIKNGSLHDVEEGKHMVIQDYDENSLWKKSNGLESFIRTKYKNIPMIIMDNHNHAFYFWYEARHTGLIRDGCALLHIDHHTDLRAPQDYLLKPDSYDLQKVYDYTNTILNVGNFILPAQKEGLISEVIQIRSWSKLKTFKNWKVKNFILDLDLDFFQYDIEKIPFENKKRIILHLAQQANFITVATSPFFMDQKKAINFLKDLFDS